MYLSPYNNPRAGLYSLQSQLHSSTLNLATSREPQASRPFSNNYENSPEPDSAGQSRGVPGRLHKARSLDVLTESWSQTQMERDVSTSAGLVRRTSNTSIERSLSSFSSSSESESSSSLKDEAQEQHPQPNVSDSGRSSPDLSLTERPSSSRSSESAGSGSSKGNGGTSVTPRVPPRPKTEEILNRCTTMTRKAAMATKTRRQIQHESKHRG